MIENSFRILAARWGFLRRSVIAQPDRVINSIIIYVQLSPVCTVHLGLLTVKMGAVMLLMVDGGAMKTVWECNLFLIQEVTGIQNIKKNFFKLIAL